VRARRLEGKTVQDRKELAVFSHLRVVSVVICDLVGGQIGLKKVVDDGNLTYFIIRYRYSMIFTKVRVCTYICVIQYAGFLVFSCCLS
jgi:hypothetical protein